MCAQRLVDPEEGPNDLADRMVGNGVRRGERAALRKRLGTGVKPIEMSAEILEPNKGRRGCGGCGCHDVVSFLETGLRARRGAMREIDLSMSSLPII
jgi:hypothetical protein